MVVVEAQMRYNGETNLARNGTTPLALDMPLGSLHAQEETRMRDNSAILAASPDSANSKPREFDSDGHDITHHYRYPAPVSNTHYPPLLTKFVGRSRAICADLLSVQNCTPRDLVVFAYDCAHWQRHFAEYLTESDADAMARATEVAFDELDRREFLCFHEDATPRTRPGYVYLLSSPFGFYKIGCSIKPKNRLLTFGVTLPFEVECICLIYSRDMYGLEKQLHQHFADRRTRGEWFELSDADIEYVKGLAT